MATSNTIMSRLRERAEELLGQGLTDHRAFRVLKSEFRSVERDMLLRAIKLPGAPTGINRLWTQMGQPLRPVVIRQWGRKQFVAVEPVTMRERIMTMVRKNPLTLEVAAKDLWVGDWVVDRGPVVAVAGTGLIVVTFENDEGAVYWHDDKILVHMEDYGESEATN